MSEQLDLDLIESRAQNPRTQDLYALTEEVRRLRNITAILGQRIIAYENEEKLRLENLNAPTSPTTSDGSSGSNLKSK